MRLLLILLLMIASPSLAVEPKTQRFVVYYTDQAPSQTFEPYDVIVFDSQAHPQLRPLQHRGKLLLGYLSLGEGEKSRSSYAWQAKQKLLLSENPDWPGHRVLDIRNPVWAAHVVENLIPDILHHGFDGIFLDTVDSPIYLETLDPKTYPGMKQAAVELIKTIRLHYPRMPIVLNRGFDILPEIASDISGVLAESIYTAYDFKNKKHRLQPKEHYASVANFLKTTQSNAPRLTIYTLDYWPESDSESIKSIYAAQRAQGFIPYVAPIDLQTVMREP